MGRDAAEAKLQKELDALKEPKEEKKRDLKFVQKETVRLKNGRYVQAVRKSTGTIFI